MTIRRGKYDELFYKTIDNKIMLGQSNPSVQLKLSTKSTQMTLKNKMFGASSCSESLESTVVGTYFYFVTGVDVKKNKA